MFFLKINSKNEFFLFFVPLNIFSAWEAHFPEIFLYFITFLLEKSVKKMYIKEDKKII